jgi:hypothetical protein
MTRAAKSKEGANEAYRRPRVGEKRKHRKPLRIDRLSAEVKGTIIAARRDGMTWEQTALAASAKAGIHLSHSTVQRWYDLRVEQSRHDAAIAPLLREIIDLLKSRLPAVTA